MRNNGARCDGTHSHRYLFKKGRSIMRGEFNRKPAHADTPGKGTVFSQYIYIFCGGFHR
jgi:hypothetical protein